MVIPKLIFYYAMPFDRGRRELFAERGEEYPTQEEVQKKVQEYRKIWEEENKDDRIMKLMVERVGHSFPRDIEVFVFGKGMGAMSHPFLMPAFSKVGVYSREKIIETLVHETLHRFMGEKRPGGPEFRKTMQGEFGHEPVVTQNHIMVYAFLYIILGELYGYDRLPDFIKPDHPGYQRAVEIVKEKSAQSLVDRYRAIVE